MDLLGPVKGQEVVLRETKDGGVVVVGGETQRASCAEDLLKLINVG